MPALYIFGRRTLLAGDDLQLPALAWGAVSGVQLFLFLPYLLCHVVYLLLTTALDDDYGYGADDAADDWTEATARRLGDVDDGALGAFERRLAMQTAACERAATLQEFDFPCLLLIYFAGVAIYDASSLWHEQRIFRVSSRGTPTRNLSLRAPLRELIETKLTFLAGSNFLLLLYGLLIALVFVRSRFVCFPGLWWFALFVLLASQAVQCLAVCTTLLALFRVRPTAPGTDYQRHGHSVDHPHAQNNVEMAEELWQSRCEGCCRILAISTCFLFGGRGIVAAEGRPPRQLYGDIARVLADYFAGFGERGLGAGGLDVVPSDIGLGFVMLQHIQAQRRMLAQRDASRQTGDESDAPSPDAATFLFRRASRPTSLSQECQGGDGDGTCPTEEAYHPFSRAALSPANPLDRATIEEGAHFARHQLAIYTWILCESSVIKIFTEKPSYLCSPHKTLCLCNMR